MDAPASPARPSWSALIVFVLAFDLAFAWQHLGGAHRSEFGGHPDEAAHVVTGLFVRDAVAEAGRLATGGGHGPPVQVGKAFAEDYYAHYPKIGLGVWPPFFYLTQAVWTLAFGASRLALLLLMCALAAILAQLMFRTLREECGTASAALGAALLLSLPLVRGHYGMIMAETLSAVLMFGAMLAFGSFLDRERRADALWFGLFAALAILTKGTGLALAMAAPLALLFTRRWHLLKRPALWAAVLLVALVAGPWTWATRHLGKGGWLQPAPSWSFTLEALPYYATKFGLALGAVFLVFFAVGAIAKVRAPGPQVGRWAAAAALLLAVLIFQSLTPVGLEARHLISLLPAGMMFAVAGAVHLARGPGRGAILLAVLGFAQIAWMSWPLPVKGAAGFAPLAAAFLEEAALAEAALVSSDAAGEGMFIAEVALRERRPGHFIQRASKALASSSWRGGDYAPAFASDEAVFDFLTSGKIRYLVLDDTLPRDKRREHHDQLQRVVQAHSDRFWPLAEVARSRGGEPQDPPLRLYKISRQN